MNSKTTVNKIFSKMKEKTELSNQRVDLSLTSDIEKAAGKTRQLVQSVKEFSTEYKNDAMAQSDAFVEKAEIAQKLVEAEKVFEIADTVLNDSEQDYKDSMKDASNHLKALNSLVLKAKKAINDLGIDANGFPAMGSLTSSIRELEGGISDGKNNVRGIG
tara:strand:+ start:883 stop:1362 length:480 start_codon:yes stop_codon:yes gene_type:complete